MADGWIKLHRSMMEWEWHDNPNVMTVWIHLLMMANTTDAVWHGITINRGQLVTSVHNLSVTCGLTEKQTRIALDKLKMSEQIVTKGANKFTMITICKYDSYQQSQNEEGQTKGEQRANKGQTKGDNIRIKEYKNNILSSSSYSEGAVEIDFPKLAEYWNEKTKGIFHPIVGADFDSNEERRLRTLDIINTFGKEQFLIAIEKAIHSDFLKDRSRAFWFNFDWMIVRRNFDSLINGHYDKNKQYGNDTTKRPNRPSVQDVSTPTEGSTCDF